MTSNAVRLRLACICGAMGPAVFVIGWAVLGATREGYSLAGDAISELARDGTSTQSAMTAVFLLDGLGVLAFASALRRLTNTATAVSAAVSALATIGVAAFPLGTAASDRAHFFFAAVGYVTLAATPALAASKLGRWRRQSLAIAAASTALLIASTLVPDSLDGVFQRAGLGVVDAWFIVFAIATLVRSFRD